MKAKTQKTRSQASVERVLRELDCRLCSGDKQVRAEHWRRLIYTLRQGGLKLDSPADVLMELLSVTGGKVHPTAHLAHQEYGNLSSRDKDSVDQRYRECLEAAKAEFPHLFFVQVINAPSSPADVWLADRIPNEELPRLNASQKSIAKAFDISEQEYARSKAARQFSEDRYRLHAERCWDFLKEAARSHSVEFVEVVYDVFSGRFYCELRQEGRARRFFLDAHLVSDPLEKGDRAGLEKAREAIRFAVDQAFASEAVPTLG